MTRRLLLVLILLFISVYSFCQFEKKVTLSVSNYGVERIENIDFDQDGDVDIVVAVQTIGKIGWYENLGNGVFSDEHYVVYGYHGGMYDFSIGDVDQDGDLDVVMPSQSLNMIKWFENDGTMNFNNVHTITTNVNSPRNTELKDLDGDLDLDVISTSVLDDKIAWYENLGGGTFGTQQVLSTTLTDPDDVRSADMDNDGDNDIVVAMPGNSGIYLINNLGGGVFAAAQLIVTGIALPMEVNLIDMDGDTLIDVIYAFRGASIHIPTGGVAWSKNLGVNTFQAPITINANPIVAFSMEAVDFDNDGDIDVLCGSNGLGVVGQPIDSINIDSLHVYLNDGTQNFTISDIASFYSGSTTVPASVSVGDLDGDGVLDVSSCSSGLSVNRATWYKQIGAGILGTENHLFHEVNGPRNSASRDIDQDGLPDLVVISSNDEKISWYKNLGNGAYADQQTIGYAKGLSPYDFAIEDFNGDGDLDVVVCGHKKEILHFENLGSSVFGAATVVAIDSLGTRDIHASDINGDGNKDIVLVNFFDHQLVWHPSLGNGTFGSRVVISDTTFNTESIWCEDLDNDGDIDILAAKGEVSWWENDGTGVFTSSTKIALYSPATCIITADLDDDGLKDIICSSENGDAVFWYKNNGSGNFSDEKYIAIDAHEHGDVRVTDLDNDGDIDVVSISSDPYSYQSISWHENLGGGQFALSAIIADSTTNGSSIVLDDFDLDGDQDVAFTSFNADGLFYALNCNITNRQIKGRLFIDVNQNLTFDSTDLSFAQIGINSTPISSKKYVYTDGRYYIVLEDTAVYNIFPGTIANWGINTDSVSYTINADSTFTFEDSLDFGFYPTNFIDSLELDAVGGLPRCNDTINYWINYENLGTTLPSGIISIELDDSLTYVSANTTPDSIVGNTVYWSYDSLNYFTSGQINLFVGMPDLNSIGDTLQSLILMHVVDGLGNIVYTVTDTLEQINICAYDPNDKQAEPAGVDLPGYIDPSTSSLDYTIRFQNTGNDTAAIVLIKDQLDPSLDWNSLEIKSFSHPMTFGVSQTGEAKFSFNNINLPDSTIDFLGSQGYVKFSIDILPGLALGTQIANTANIYFDLNTPIVTNTKLNTLYDCANLFAALPLAGVCLNNNLLFDADLSTTTLDWIITGITAGIGNQINWFADTLGSFSLSIQASNSFCTSDTTFNLMVYPEQSIYMLDTITVCHGESAFIFFQWQNTSGVYTQSYNSVFGCDSILAKTLIVLPAIPLNIIDSLNICPGDSVQIFGNYEQQSGLYQDTTQNAFGCDSTIAYFLEVFSQIPQNLIDTLYVCNGDSLQIFGNYEQQPGFYQNTMQNAFGCDSTNAYYLEVIPQNSQNLIDTLYICPGDSLQIFGNYEQQSGLYQNTMQNAYGCDSTNLYFLNLYPDYQNLPIINVDICDGDSALIFGSYETDQNLYTHMHSTINGCDSLEKIQLNVNTNPSAAFGSIGVDTVCANHPIIQLNGSTPAGGIYFGPGISGSDFSPAIAGVGNHYLSYTFQDTNGCTATDSVLITVNGCLGINENELLGLSIHPNPFSTETLVEFGRKLNNEYDVQLINMLGQAVLTFESIEGDNLVLKKNKLSSGVYMLKIIHRQSNQVMNLERLVVR